MALLQKRAILDVKDSYDVIVAGGGVAGISAALAARRQGARVLLIEREYMLGGLATLGLITIYLPLCDGEGHLVSRGIAEELLHLSISHGAEVPLSEAWEKYMAGKRVPIEKRREARAQCRYNANLFSILAEQKLREEGVDILFGTLVCDAALSRGKITHLIVENKSGRYAYGVKSVVDATGDSDVARVSGAKTALFGQGNILAAWYYYGDGQKANNLQMIGACDTPDEDKSEEHKRNDTRLRFSGLDGEENSRIVSLAHDTLLKHFLERGELSGTHTLNTVATVPQVRMTRRIEAPTVMGTDSVHTYMKDSVGLFADWRKRGPVYEMPFSTLYSVNVKNLIAAGRNISVTDGLWDVTRVIPVCAVSGEAAGCAAAMSDNFARLSVRRLQSVLRKNGVILHEKK